MVVSSCFHPEFQPFLRLRVYNSCFYLLLIWVKFAVCKVADDVEDTTNYWPHGGVGTCASVLKYGINSPSKQINHSH